MGSLQANWGMAVLDLEKGDDATDGGIAIPDRAVLPRFRGRVMSVGEGRVTQEGKIYPPEVKPGMVVETDRFRGYTVRFEGKKYYVMPEKMIGAEWVDVDETAPASVFTEIDPNKIYEYVHHCGLYSEAGVPTMEIHLSHLGGGWHVHEYSEPIELSDGESMIEIRALRREIFPKYEGPHEGTILDVLKPDAKAFYTDLIGNLEHLNQRLEDKCVADDYQRKFQGDLSNEELDAVMRAKMANEPSKPAQYQEPKDRSTVGLTNAIPNVMGNLEFLTVTLALYDREKDDIYNPEWRQYKKYLEDGWQIHESEVSPTITLVKRLSRPRRR